MAHKDRNERNTYARKWYAANKERHLKLIYKNRKKYVKEIRKIIEIAKAKPCADCGMQYHTCVMDFDHIKGEKLFNIGQTATKFGVETLFEEIAKCEVVCANCHRIRSFIRRGLAQG